MHLLLAPLTQSALMNHLSQQFWLQNLAGGLWLILEALVQNAAFFFATPLQCYVMLITYLWVKPDFFATFSMFVYILYVI